MLLSATLVSSSFIVGELIAGEVDPLLLTLGRFAIAAILLAPYVFWKYGVDISLSFLLRTSFISGSLVIFFWCMFFSLRYTSAFNTSVIFTLAPSLAGIYAWLLLREKPGWETLLALLVGLIGAVWVLFEGDLQQLQLMQWNKGDGIFFAGCLFMAFYTISIRMFHRGEPMIVLTLWILITGTGWLLLGSVSMLFSDNPGNLSSKVIWAVVYLAVFSTIITFFITQYSILFIGPTKVMCYSYLYPALVLVMDALLGRGLPAAAVFPGICLVFGAMFLILREEKRQDLMS